MLGGCSTHNGCTQNWGWRGDYDAWGRHSLGWSADNLAPAFARARKAGGKIIFVTCWPGSDLENFVDLQIAPAVGPEIIAGSTRLKAGTATKMVLNMLTTISMIKLGKTYGNLMVDVQTGSEKLKDRARRILRHLDERRPDAYRETSS